MSSISEIDKKNIYFLHIPNKTNDLQLTSNKINQYVIIKISKVYFDNIKDNFDDYYELSSNIFELYKLQKINKKHFNDVKKYNYNIDYLFLTKGCIYRLVYFLNISNIQELFYDTNPLQNLKFNKESLQNVLEKIYNYMIPINNKFCFNDISEMSHKIIFFEKIIDGSIYYMNHLKTFNINSINYFDKNIKLHLKYISLVNTFKLLNKQRYSDDNYIINSLNFMNDLHIYTPLVFNNDSINNKNIDKFNFINSNILSKKKDGLKYTYHLKNKNSSNTYKIMNSSYNKSNITLNLKIYIKKEVLNNIINNKIHRKWIYEFFNFNSENTSLLNYKDFSNYTFLIDNRKFEYTIKEIKKLNIKPFEYQFNNLKWMNYVENLKDNNNYYDYLGNIDFCYLKNVNIPNKNLVFLSNNSTLCELKDINDHSFISKYKKKFYTNGGILSDEVGLGKTLSSLLLILSKEKEDKKKIFDYNNLIITPNRLVEQWYIELISYVSKRLKIIKILTISDIKKKLYDIDKSKYNIYIISSNLLTNENYLNYINKEEGYDLKSYMKYILKLKKNELKEHHKLVIEKIADKQNLDPILEILNINLSEELKDYIIDKNKKFNIFNVKWNRIFVDEAHEIIKSRFDNTSLNLYSNLPCDIKKEYSFKKNEEYKFFQLMKLQSNYKWCLTATPFKSKNKNMIGYMLFLNSHLNIPHKIKYDSNKYIDYFKETTNMVFNFKDSDIQTIFRTLIRQNKKKDLKNQIDIPIFTEEITYLKQNNIERNIYIEESRNNNISRLLQLCTHLVVSDDNINLDNFKFSLMNLDTIRNLNLTKYKKQLSKYNKDIEECNINILNSNNSIEKIKLLLELLKNKDFNFIHYSKKDEINNFLRQFRRTPRSRYFRDYEYSADIMKNIKDMIFDDDFITNFTTNYNEVCKTIYDIYINEYIVSDKEKLYFIFRLYQFKLESIKNINKTNIENIEKFKKEISRLEIQIRLFSNTDFVKEYVNEPCSICFEPYEQDTKIAITVCRHVMCSYCINTIFKNKYSINCPFCRQSLTKNDINFTVCNFIKKEEKEENKTDDDKIKKYGTKLSYLIDYITELFKNDENRIIIFSQYDRMLKLIGKVLDDFKIKNLFVKGNIMSVSKNILKFKTDKSYKIIMLSSERSSSGNNLTEASHIIFVDAINGDKKLVKDLETQAIGRAVRLGQKKPVKVKRLIMKNTIEEEYYNKNKYDMEELQ